MSSAVSGRPRDILNEQEYDIFSLTPVLSQPNFIINLIFANLF